MLCQPNVEMQFHYIRDATATLVVFSVQRKISDVSSAALVANSRAIVSS